MKVFFFLLISFLAFSGHAERVKSDSRLYQDQFRRLALALQWAPESLLLSKSVSAPKGSYELRQFFLRLCSSQDSRDQSLEIETLTDGQKLFFSCDEKKKGKGTRGWLFSGVLTQDNRLLSFELQEVSPHRAQFELSEAAKVSLALGSGLLASSFLSRTLYPNQDDKLLHFYAGDVISSLTGLGSYYGFKATKNQAILWGLGVGCLAGIAKEVYDSRHPDKHVKDKNDALATFLGAGLGAVSLRVAFEF